MKIDTVAGIRMITLICGFTLRSEEYASVSELWYYRLLTRYYLPAHLFQVTAYDLHKQSNPLILILSICYF